MDAPGEVRELDGSLRPALAAERDLMTQWTRSFAVEVGETPDDSADRVSGLLAEGNIWVWDNDGAVSMAVTRKPAEGVVRISGVFTPPEERSRGYAGACVRAISKKLQRAGLRSVLYTDLANPISNSIYQRVGYRVVSEGLRYRFS